MKVALLERSKSLLGNELGVNEKTLKRLGLLPGDAVQVETARRRIPLHIRLDRSLDQGQGALCIATLELLQDKEGEVSPLREIPSTSAVTLRVDREVQSAAFNFYQHFRCQMVFHDMVASIPTGNGHLYCLVDLGSADSTLVTELSQIQIAYDRPTSIETRISTPQVSTVFVGSPQSGKTSFLLSLTKPESSDVVSLPASTLLGSPRPDRAFAKLYQQARLSNGSLCLLVDDLDRLFHFVPGSMKHQLTAIVNHLLLEKNVRLLCTATTLDDIPQSTLSLCHVASCPVAQENQSTRSLRMAQTLAFQTKGNLHVTEDEIGKANRFAPLGRQEPNPSQTMISWNDIGGSMEGKETLQQCVKWCKGEESALFSRFGVAPPRGVLLFGPPGCSKTMLAKALANESKLPFLSIKGPEVYSKWVGESEKAVRDLFSRARAAAPCVVFIDELDGMCSVRGKGGVSDRVISQFLTELDGIPSTGTSDSILIVAATNRPENIDAAVLRPGRIDRRVFVGLPSLAERVAILKIATRGLPLLDVSLEELASLTDGFTGAEMVALVKEATFAAIAEDLHTNHVRSQHFTLARTRVSPKVTEGDLSRYQSWCS
jgi:SpoVK/Ycf46/Vps4 family AAA+-type ATPase